MYPPLKKNKNRRANAWTLCAAAVLMCGIAVIAAPAEPAEETLDKIAMPDDCGLVVAGGAALIDINRAGVELLMLLPGIGETLAGRIAARRDAHGPFRSVEELTRISGIGPGKLDAIRPLVTCVAPTPTPSTPR